MLRQMIVLAALVTSAPARASDVGEIAVVADVGGTIHDAVSIPLPTYLQRAACAFYRTHDDRYDVLFVWTSARLTALNRTQQGWAVRPAARGIGRDGMPDASARYCSGRLAHAVKMGDIGSFGDDPDAVYTGAHGFTLSGVQLMGHELGHQWLAGVTFTQADGRRRCVLRGFSGAQEMAQVPFCEGYANADFTSHWSYYLDGNSVMYSNAIEDLGGGRFRLSHGTPKYSALDQYLMGLRTPSEVPPMFLIERPLGTDSTGFPVARGQTEIVTGERLDFTIQDVIRAEGPRVPASEACHKKAAFVLLHPDGAPPSAAEIARVDAYRRRFEAFYAEATDQRGSFDTTLAGTGDGTVGCPSRPRSPGEDAGVVAADDATVAEADADPAEVAADAGPARKDAEVVADSGAGVRVVLDAEGCSCGASGPSAMVAPVAVLLAMALRRRRS